MQKKLYTCIHIHYIFIYWYTYILWFKKRCERKKIPSYLPPLRYRYAFRMHTTQPLQGIRAHLSILEMRENCWSSKTAHFLLSKEQNPQKSTPLKKKKCMECIMSSWSTVVHTTYDPNHVLQLWTRFLPWLKGWESARVPLAEILESWLAIFCFRTGDFFSFSSSSSSSKE